MQLDRCQSHRSNNELDARHIEQGASAMNRQTILITASILLAGCASSLSQDIGGSSGSIIHSENDYTLVDTHSDSRGGEEKFERKDKDLSGFSGYSWGASREFVEAGMREEEYDLIASGNRDLWYSGAIADEKLQFVYVFDHDLLVSGMWIFDDVDKESYWRVNELLRKTYGVSPTPRIRGDVFIESEMTPPNTDARIIHKLDVEHDDHEVHYYFHPRMD